MSSSAPLTTQWINEPHQYIKYGLTESNPHVYLTIDPRNLISYTGIFEGNYLFKYDVND